MNDRRLTAPVQFPAGSAYGVLDLDACPPGGPVAEKERVTVGNPDWLPEVLQALAVERAEFEVAA